jgi:hypothetical protein
MHWFLVFSFKRIYKPYGFSQDPPISMMASNGMWVTASITILIILIKWNSAEPTAQGTFLAG